jgi:hypothetical protein
MKTRSAPRPGALLIFCTAIAISPGCASGGPDAEYGLSRGTSLNGTAAFGELLRSRGSTVRAAVRLTDELAVWAKGLVRFAPYPGPPEAEEALWFTRWLDEDPDRWLIYVVRDFDSSAEYWRDVRDGISESGDPARRAEAEENRVAAADWVFKLPEKPKKTGDAHDWFKVEALAGSPKVCTKLEGPWAEDVDAAAAAVWVHEAMARDRRAMLLGGDDKALVVDKSLVGGGNILIVANGSFLLNEALVNGSRRRLAIRVAEWPQREIQNVAFVEGSFVLGEEEGTPSLWRLLQRLPALKWVAGQMAVAAIFAALARAPRLGRPRPDAASGSDRPAAHAEALGALLAAGRANRESHELLERYRLWRWPHAARGASGAGARFHPLEPAGEAGSAAVIVSSREKDPAPDSAKPAEPEFG